MPFPDDRQFESKTPCVGVSAVQVFSSILTGGTLAFWIFMWT